MFACEISLSGQVLPTLKAALICIVGKGFGENPGINVSILCPSNLTSYPSIPCPVPPMNPKAHHLLGQRMVGISEIL